MSGFWLGLVAFGIGYIAMGLPLAKGMVKPNGLYGFRTPRTLADVDLWYPANAISGRDLVAAGATMIGVAIGLMFAMPVVSETVGLTVLSTVVLVATIAAIARTFWATSVLVAQMDATREQVGSEDIASEAAAARGANPRAQTERN